MKPVQSSLRRWMQTNKNFKERHEKLKEEVFSDKSIKQFLTEHPTLSQEIIDKNLVTLYEYKTQSKQCSHCTSLKNCKNILQGYTPILSVVNDEIHLSYEKCQKLIASEKRKDSQRLIKSLYMPKEILDARIDKIDPDPARHPAVLKLINFAREAKESLPEKGLYLSGPFGVGKTYLLGALANRLSEYDISSTLIYMPEFVRELRDAIKDDTVTEKINFFKTADVLMIDDIGAETQSAWFRDEVLGSILQYRMMERLPVFFTSNYTMGQLEKQLATSTRGDVEEIKAGRILERIRQVSKEVSVEGENRRGY